MQEQWLKIDKVLRQRFHPDEREPRLQLLIRKVLDGEDLSADEAREAMLILMEGRPSDYEIAAFLMAYRLKPRLLPEELAGFASVMREKAEKLPLPAVMERLSDTCGTGCDKSNSFNVSTTVMFVLAGAGIPVAKHGNRGITSGCGSADVLEALGVRIDMTPEKAAECLTEVGVTFLFAPNFHKATKNVQPIRRALKQLFDEGTGDFGQLRYGTIFNLLGPLSNPAPVKRQLLGVFDEQLTELMAGALKLLGAERAMCVCGAGEGMLRMDEFSTIGRTHVTELRDGALHSRDYSPEQFGFQPATADDLRGGDKEESAKILRDILSGEERGARRDVVLLNAGAAIYICGDAVPSIADGIEMARAVIESGKALEKLDDLIRISNT